MITLERPAYYGAKRYSEYTGLSTDDKLIIDAYNSDEFYEIDTGKIYKYNAASNEWIEQPEDTTVIDTGLPPITSETAGHFLSNDGDVTHWQEFASADFIITLTPIAGQEGEYTADKTFVEVKTAYDAKENIAVSYDNARLPLMNAQFANGGSEGGFTFGYTQVTTNGSLVSTRAINYFHTANADEWTDNDQVGEYLKVSGGTIDGNLSMANNNITDVQELRIDGEYPLYLGNVIHPTGTSGVRITSTTNNEAAIVATDSQSVYKPINVGTPTAPNHAVNLAYLTQEMRDEPVSQKVLSFDANTGHTYTLNDGVYMLVTCDDGHSGVAVINISGDKFKVSHVCTLSSWTVSKGAVSNSIYINNLSTTSALDVYVISL